MEIAKTKLPIKKRINTKQELIKSPLNYVGGKYNLLPQILPLFPKNINTLVDLFGGGGDVAFNVIANRVVFNELDANLVNLFLTLKKTSPNKAVSKVKEVINKYNLSIDNKEGFLKLREDFNNGQDDAFSFYAMVVHSFNYQIEYNLDGKFNTPSGKSRSYFNPSLESRLLAMTKRLNKLNVEFISSDFRNIDLTELTSRDFVYLDPPYLVSGRTPYQKYWGEEQEIQLLNLADELNVNGVKFALSNVLEHKGRENLVLKEWSKDYNVRYLNYDYSNSNYQTKDRRKNGSIEVLITNY